MIPFANPLAQTLELRRELDQAIADVLASGRYVLGPQVKAFEEEFATWLGTSWCVGVGNGTDAIHVALRALGIGPGDEVILPSMTATATGTAVWQCGATPVFAEVDPSTRTIDPAHARNLVGPRTKALIAVHLYGHPCDMDALQTLCREREVHLVEDCAQAHGATYRGRKVGTFGILSCFSFYPTKNLGAIGDGGAVAGSLPALGEAARLLREYGWKERYHSSHEGWNTRLDELQAAILRVKLPHLDRDNSRRRAIAERYERELSGCGLVLPTVGEGCGHVFHLYAVESPDRDLLAQTLAKSGVGTLVHYPLGIHQQKLFSEGRAAVSLPITEGLARSVLSLPMFPQLTETDQERVVQAVLDATQPSGGRLP